MHVSIYLRSFLPWILPSPIYAPRKCLVVWNSRAQSPSWKKERIHSLSGCQHFFHPISKQIRPLPRSPTKAYPDRRDQRAKLSSIPVWNSKKTPTNSSLCFLSSVTAHSRSLRAILCPLSSARRAKELKDDSAVDDSVESRFTIPSVSPDVISQISLCHVHALRPFRPLHFVSTFETSVFVSFDKSSSYLSL